VTAPVSIIIPAYNQIEYCRQCIHSLLANTPQPYKLILVDNGSDDGVGPFFDSIPGATVVHTGQNLGFAGGVNAGLAHCEGHALLLNSDTILPQGWLEPLLAALDADPAIAMAGPRSNCVSGEQQIDGLALTTMDEINAYTRTLRAEYSGKMRYVSRLVGFCLLIRDAVCADLGGMDEAFGIGNFEDDDYCLRARRAGYRLVIVEDSFVFHYGSRTFQAMGLTGAEWDALMERNRSVFDGKWQNASAIGEEHMARARILNQAAKETGDPLEAVKLLKEAIEAAPAWEVNYNDLAVRLWEMGETQAARRYLDEALRRNPHYAAARENLRTIAPPNPPENP